MSPPRQHPVLAFAVALAAVAVLSAMDAVMKGLVLAIGLYATSLWRALVGAGAPVALWALRRRRDTPDGSREPAPFPMDASKPEP